jgi:hypothetical protein
MNSFYRPEKMNLDFDSQPYEWTGRLTPKLDPHLERALGFSHK